MPYISIFVLICAVLGMLIGLWKGARKKIAGISAIVLSVLISLLITPPILKAVITEETVNMIAELLGFTSRYNELVAASPSIAELILGIPVAIIAPLVFLLIYAILRIIFRIVAGIVSKIIFTKKNWVISKVIGLPLGFLQGALAAMVVVVIFAGMISTVNNVTDTVLAQDSEQLAEVQDSVAEIDEYVNIVANDPIVKMLENTNFIYNSLNSFDFNDEKVVLKDEITAIADAGVNLLPLSENTQISTWSDAEYESLDAFVEKFGTSKILPQISSEILSAACAKWADGESFMGIEAPKADDNIDPLLIALYASFKTSTPETIVVDLGSLVDILEIVGKHDLLSGNTSDIMSNLSGTFISELLNVISTNERFSVLVPEVTNLSLRMLASVIKLPANTGEVYNNITSSISADLNNYLTGDKDDVSAQQFKNSVTTSLKNNGINVSDEISTMVANTMANAFAGKENITQEDVQNYFADYANIYETVENTETNTASNDETVKLESSTSGAASTSSFYDYEKMTFEEKIAALSAIGVLDYCRTNFDISAPENILSNGMTADQYLNYILEIYNSVIEDYEEISTLGSSDSNPVVSLKSSETIITSKTTTEDLLINTDGYNLTDKDIENISQGFDNISSFITSYNQLEGPVSLDTIAQLDLEAVGKALDLLQDTDLLGDKVGTVADALIGEMTGANVSISQSIENGNVTFESLMTTVKSTSTVIGNLSNSNCTEEEKEAAILDLLLNITPETSGVISEIVTEDFMVQFGIPADYAYTSANALKVALVEMAYLPEAEHDVEAAKLKHLFDLASSAGNSDKSMIGENGIFKSETDIIDMIVGSSVAYKTITTISTDNNGNTVKDALGLAKSMSVAEKDSLGNTLVNYYNANKTSTSVANLAERLNAIVILFDLGITIK